MQHYKLVHWNGEQSPYTSTPTNPRDVIINSWRTEVDVELPLNEMLGMLAVVQADCGEDWATVLRIEDETGKLVDLNLLNEYALGEVEDPAEQVIEQLEQNHLRKPVYRYVVLLEPNAVCYGYQFSDVEFLKGVGRVEEIYGRPVIARLIRDTTDITHTRREQN